MLKLLLTTIIIFVIIILALFVSITMAEKKLFDLQEIISTYSEKVTNLVVLGAQAFPNGPSLELVCRLNLAHQLSKKILISNIFLFGGIGINGTNEVEVMKDYLISKKVPVAKIATNAYGINTWKSLKLYSKELKLIECVPTIVITSSYHVFRVKLVSRLLNCDFKVVSPKSSPESANKKIKRIRITTEIFACIWYLLPEMIRNVIDTRDGTFRHKVPNWFIRRIT